MSIPNSRPLLDNRGAVQQPVWRVRQLVIGFASLSLVTVLYLLFLCPQYFNSSVSISMQQPATPSVLGALGALGGTSVKKYVGVLKSRRFAEEVEARAHLQQLYHLRNRTEAIEKVMRAVRFDDNTIDGLIYIDVSLDAPAKLSAGSTELRDKVRNTCALIANSYGDVFRKWLITQDTEKDSVLLREAEVEVATVRRDYDASVAEMLAFMRSRHARPPVVMSAYTAAAAQATGSGSNSGGSAQSTPSPGSIEGGSAFSEASSVAGQYSTLYARRAQLETQMHSLDTLQTKIKSILNGPLQEVAAIPSEDPLLFDARRQYNAAYTNLQNLSVGLASQNPKVIEAQGVLKLARERFVNQMKAVLEGHTSDQMRRDVMSTEYEMLNKQIKDQERMFHDSRDLATQLTLRTSEVALRLKILETAMQADEQLKITTVSAKNRFAIVDVAIPAEHSRPGLLLIAAAGIAIPLVLISAWYMILHLRIGAGMGEGSSTGSHN